MNYTLHQLHVFLKIVETKSITKAAQELNLTQPAVSIQYKNFQDQFEIPLTEIVGRQLYVTEFGFEIAEIAERISNEVQEIQFKTMAYKGHLTGTLKSSKLRINSPAVFTVLPLRIGPVVSNGFGGVWIEPLSPASTVSLKPAASLPLPSWIALASFWALGSV